MVSWDLADLRTEIGADGAGLVAAPATALDDQLAAGDWEAALATIAYTPDFADTNRMGAMLFGGVTEERIQFNEQSLWSGDNNWDGKYETGDHGFNQHLSYPSRPSRP